MQIYGLDFTSVPSSRKPITCAGCRLADGRLQTESFEKLESFRDFERFLAQPGPWVAGLDFPFGQPRKLIENLGWPQTWIGYVRQLTRISKVEFEALLAQYRAGRANGDKQHLRRTDQLAGSKSPMMMFGVPVGKMFYEGAHRLLESGASVLPCHPQDDSRIILEAYPGLAARRWIQQRSYKNDARRKQTSERKAARVDLLRGLRSQTAQAYYGFAIDIDGWFEALIDDGSGDLLDALLCAIQAGWAASQREPQYGIPADCDPLEGWIVDPSLIPGSV